MDIANANVNNILKAEITKLDYTLNVRGGTDDTHVLRSNNDTISAIIDRLGHMSAVVQGLNKVITTGRKMRERNYIIYLLKDAAANDNKGEVVGMLKVGQKHLYLDDKVGNSFIIEPLCVLDFFVMQNRQRSGLGKKLFDYMLKDMKMPPNYLAIDGPSPIMLQFLARNYGLKNMIRNANNFAVASDFYDNIDEIRKSITVYLPPVSTPSGAGRFTAPRPESNIGRVIHGNGLDNVDDMSHSRYNRIY